MNLIPSLKKFLSIREALVLYMISSGRLFL